MPLMWLLRDFLVPKGPPPGGWIQGWAASPKPSRKRECALGLATEHVVHTPEFLQMHIPPRDTPATLS